MGDKILYFPHTNRETDEQKIKNIDIEDITALFSVLSEEERVRSQLTSVLRKYPSLIKNYLSLNDWEREEFEEFRKRYPAYLTGEGDGCGIQYLSAPLRDDLGIALNKGFNRVVSIAVKCRWSNQLLEIFNSYMKNKREERFNNSYISSARKGRNLLQNVRKSWFTDMGEVVNLAAQVEPDILRYCQLPGYCEDKIVQLNV